MQQMLTRLKTQFTDAYADENPELMGCILDTELLRKKKKYKWNKQDNSRARLVLLNHLVMDFYFCNFSIFKIIKFAGDHAKKFKT